MYYSSVIICVQDVLLLSQFVQEDGEIVPRQITGICYDQHRKLKDTIRKAHTAGTGCLGNENSDLHFLPVVFTP